MTKEQELQLLGTQGICECCGKAHGTYCYDPFDEDVNGVETLTCLCDECYDAIAGDI
jgi:hypothetical protein